MGITIAAVVSAKRRRSFIRRAARRGDSRSPDGLDEGGVSELLPQARDVHVQRPFAAVARRVEHVVREPSAGDRFAGAVRERGEEIELHPRQLDAAVVEGDLALGRVDPEGPDLDHPVAMERGAAQARADSLDQLRGPEGLGHVVVRAQLKSTNLVRAVVARAEHQHGGLAARSEVLEHVEPVGAREHQIEHDEVDLRPRARSDPAPLGPPRRLEARSAKELHDLGAEDAIVFDQENALRDRHPHFIARRKKILRHLAPFLGVR